jgi:hypothetical protein
VRFTLSRSPLLTLCAYAFRPEVTAPEAEPGPSAKIGTVAWARAVAHIDGRDDPGNGDLTPSEGADADAYYAAALRWMKDRKRLGWTCETAFAWSPSRDEARVLPKSTELRDYSDAKGDEVCGSTDLTYFDSDGVLCVEDVKTGVTPLSQYVPQISNLGMVAARAYNVRRVRIRLVKLRKDEPHEEWTRELDGFSLDALAEELRERLAAVATSEPQPGPHCSDMWCPARLACPAVPAAIAELVPADALAKRPRFSHEFVSHDNDAALLDFLRLVEKASEDLRKVIRARTPKEGAVLGDGRILREGFHDETRWRQESLIAKARELGARAGLSDEDVDRELEDCRYSFAKSEGLKVTKPKALPKAKDSAA